MSSGAEPSLEEFDPTACCQAGFDAEGELNSEPRQGLLMACSQSYQWEEEVDRCTMIYTNDAGKIIVDPMRSTDDCCLAGFNAPDGPEKSTLLMACSQIYSFN